LADSAPIYPFIPSVEEGLQGNPMQVIVWCFETIPFSAFTAEKQEGFQGFVNFIREDSPD